MVRGVRGAPRRPHVILVVEPAWARTPEGIGVVAPRGHGPTDAPWARRAHASMLATAEVGRSPAIGECSHTTARPAAGSPRPSSVRPAQGPFPGGAVRPPARAVCPRERARQGRRRTPRLPCCIAVIGCGESPRWARVPVTGCLLGRGARRAPDRIHDRVPSPRRTRPAVAARSCSRPFAGGRSCSASSRGSITLSESRRPAGCHWPQAFLWAAAAARRSTRRTVTVFSCLLVSSLVLVFARRRAVDSRWPIAPWCCYIWAFRRRSSRLGLAYRAEPGPSCPALDSRVPAPASAAPALASCRAAILAPWSCSGASASSWWSRSPGHEIGPPHLPRRSSPTDAPIRSDGQLQKPGPRRRRGLALHPAGDRRRHAARSFRILRLLEAGFDTSLRGRPTTPSVMRRPRRRRPDFLARARPSTGWKRAGRVERLSQDKPQIIRGDATDRHPSRSPPTVLPRSRPTSDELVQTLLTWRPPGPKRDPSARPPITKVVLPRPHDLPETRTARLRRRPVSGLESPVAVYTVVSQRQARDTGRRCAARPRRQAGARGPSPGR